MQNALLISILTLAVIAAAPVVAHVVGFSFARSLRVRPGAIREWMPSIPDHVETGGRAEERWERRRRRVEAKLLASFASGVSGAEAHALAAQLGEDPEVVAGALGHLREEIPCRLRVTRSGKLLHDFDAVDIHALRRKRRRTLPLRVALFVLGVLANFGAIWPVLLCVLVAVIALGVIATVGGAAVVGFSALAVVVVLFLGNLVGGWLTHLLLTPGLGSPRLGATIGAEASFAHLQAEQVAGSSMFGKKQRASGDAGGDVGGDVGGFFDLDAGCLGIIAILLLVAVVAAGTFAVFVFVRGIWRAVTGAGMPPLEMSPTQWVRSSQPGDWFERFIPTNDLVLRVMKVLRRMMSHTHPRDATIVGRVMARARAQEGRVAALEIALLEGLDLDEATAVGARLSGRASGTIDVTDGGELDFVFPVESLSEAPAQWDDDMHAEYIDVRSDEGTITRRARQKQKRLPVNLPGIAWSHVQSADRLAAGTIMMMACGIAAVNLVPDLPGTFVLAVDFFLPLLTLGTFALTGALRYTVAAMAKHGVRRDIRRAAFLAIRQSLAKQHVTVSFDRTIDQLIGALRPAWRGVTRDLVLREIEGACIDLDLQPDVDRIADVGGTWFSIEDLAARLADIEAHRERPPEDGAAIEEDALDEVVFDSQIEHERVRALA